MALRGLALLPPLPRGRPPPPEEEEEEEEEEE
eukprot:SAG25_NODE_10528_length_330_cov_0.896104_1_plen_31_part_01